MIQKIFFDEFRNIHCEYLDILYKECAMKNNQKIITDARYFIKIKKKNVDVVVDSNNKYGERKKEMSYFCDT